MAQCQSVYKLSVLIAFTTISGTLAPTATQPAGWIDVGRSRLTAGMAAAPWLHGQRSRQYSGGLLVRVMNAVSAIET